MTDHTHGYRTVLRALDGIDEGRGVTVDIIREETDAAGLSGSEKAEALTRACQEGYLTGAFMLLPWWSLDPIHAAVPSSHAPAKGRHVSLYRRTAKAIPGHVCEVT